MPAALLTPATIHALLDAHGLRPSRALGQHFLADPNTARRIMRLAGVQPGDRVLEIGPGVGSLTLALADAGARVVALELDRQILPVLATVLEDTGDVRVEHGDALSVDLDALLREGAGAPAAGAWLMVSNLPYNVATPIVLRLLDDAPLIARMLVMVQREVGERIVARPGGRDYGAVSVHVAYRATARIVGRVPPTVFLPAPKVDSVLVELVRHATPPVAVPSEAELFALVRAGFSHRRKMLRSALRAALGDRVESVLARAGIDPSARAEVLALDDWAALARATGVEGA